MQSSSGHAGWLYITLGMSVIGRACEMVLPFLKAPFPGLLFWLGGMLLMCAGIFGCVASLIWWFVAATVFAVHQRHPPSPVTAIVAPSGMK